MDVPVFQEWVGTLDGFQNAKVQAQVVGYLLTRDYTEGAFVKEGAQLFTIDPRPFEAALAQAEAALKQAEAQELRTRLDADRATQLFGEGVISQAEFDTKTQLHKADQAAVAAAQAVVESAKINLSYTTITAPFSGVVGMAQAQIGDLVGAPGGGPLTTMSMLDPIKVYFPISESEYMQAAAALQRVETMSDAERPADLTIQLANGETYPEKGRFYFADRQVNPRTGTIELAATFPNPDGLLRPGQFARVQAKVREMQNAVVVPMRAVSELQGSYSVLVLKEDNTVEMRPVQVGATYQQWWVIESGLKAGETVVVEGVNKARPGQKVDPKTAPTPTPTPTPVSGEKAGGDTGSESIGLEPTATPEPTPASTPEDAAAKGEGKPEETDKTGTEGGGRNG